MILSIKKSTNKVGREYFALCLNNKPIVFGVDIFNYIDFEYAIDVAAMKSGDEIILMEGENK